MKITFFSLSFVCFATLPSLSTASVTIESCGSKVGANYRYSYALNNQADDSINSLLLGHSVNNSPGNSGDEMQLGSPPSIRQAQDGLVYANNFEAPPGWQLFNFSEADAPKYSARFTSFDYISKRKADPIPANTPQVFSITLLKYDPTYLVGNATIKFSKSSRSLPGVQYSYSPAHSIIPSATLKLNPSSIPADGAVYRIQAEVNAADLCDPQPKVALVSVTEKNPDVISNLNSIITVSDAVYGEDDRDFSVRGIPKTEVMKNREIVVTYKVTNVNGKSSTVSTSLIVNSPIPAVLR